MRHMENFKIYYHDDMDGMCSRVIAEKIIRQRYNVDHAIEVYDLSHGAYDFNKLAEITGDEALVIIVDYSFNENTIDTFKEILRKTDSGRRLLWIDHHDSSINFVRDHILSNGAGEHLDIPYSSFLVSKSGSGAYLTWAAYKPKTFISEIDSQYEVIDMYKVIKFVPPVVRYVSDYDTFEHRLPDTDKFKLGFDSTIDKYSLIVDLLRSTTDECNSTISIGENVMNYVIAENKEVIKKQGYESRILDIGTGKIEMVYVCNRLSNSWVFGDLYDCYKYVVVYYFDGVDYKYSIFSNLKIFNDTDCEHFAKQFGGGGHKGAAGWRSKELMFIKDNFVFKGTLY